MLPIRNSCARTRIPAPTQGHLLVHDVPQDLLHGLQGSGRPRRTEGLQAQKGLMHRLQRGQATLCGLSAVGHQTRFGPVQAQARQSGQVGVEAKDLSGLAPGSVGHQQEHPASSQEPPHLRLLGIQRPWTRMEQERGQSRVRQQDRKARVSVKIQTDEELRPLHAAPDHAGGIEGSSLAILARMHQEHDLGPREDRNDQMAVAAAQGLVAIRTQGAHGSGFVAEPPGPPPGTREIRVLGKKRCSARVHLSTTPFPEAHDMRPRFQVPTSQHLVIVLTLLAMTLFTPSPGTAREDLAERCRQDLAQRTSSPLEGIRVVQRRDVLFPDAALGLPRPGEVVASVQTPGQVLVLKVGQTSHLYVGSDRTFRYGGPLGAWRHSALFLQEIPNEPNLNGRLVQTSLVGTNPRVVLVGVSDFAPQRDGSLLAIRRTSRSSHDLLYLAPGEEGPGRRLHSTFALLHFVLNPDGTRWAALERPRVGGGWALVTNSLKASPESTRRFALPEGTRPGDLVWEEGGPVLRAAGSDRKRFWQLTDLEGEGTWQELKSFASPEGRDLMLNKSESLQVIQTPDGQKVQVARVWFNGDARVLATVPELQMTEFSYPPSPDFVVVSGRWQDEPRAVVVDVHTGQVLSLPASHQGPTRLWMAPPAGRERLEGWLKPQAP